MPGQPSDEMLDRIAQSLHDVGFSDRAWEGLPEIGTVGKSGYRDRARIILRAMREPVEDQLIAAEGQCYLSGPSEIPDIWRAMISAALGEEVPERDFARVPSGTSAADFDRARMRLDASFGIGIDQAYEVLRSNVAAKRIYDCAVQALVRLDRENRPAQA